jgi:hypothetical protein
VHDTGSYAVTVFDPSGCSGTSQPVRVTLNPSPEPVIVVEGSSRFCSGGSALLDAGVGYRSYLWSNGATSRRITVSQSGSYMVTVEDSAGCRGTSLPVPITVTPAPQPIISGPDAICPGSTGRYAVADGGYRSYEWKVAGGTISDGQGTDTLTVVWPASGTGRIDLRVTTSDGCTGDAPTYRVTIGSLLHPSIMASGPLMLCSGDSITLAVSAGYASYAWSNGAVTPSIRIATGGAYWVDVQGAGDCHGRSDTAVVSVRPLPVPVIMPSGSIGLCSGDSARLEAPRGFVEYRWSNGDTGRIVMVKGSGSYSVAVVDSNGCHGVSGGADVVVYAAPARPTISMQGDTLTGSEAAGYQWFLQGVQVPGATDRSYVAVADGFYTLRIVDSNGCSAISEPYAFKHREPDPRIATAVISLPRIAAFPGERVRIPLELDSSRLLDSANLRSFAATIRLDGGILLPNDPLSTGILEGGSRLITLSGSRPFGMESGPLLWLEFTAAESSVDSTQLRIESFRWSGTPRLESQVETVDGLFRLRQVPKDTTQPDGGYGLTLGPHYPNPVRMMTTIDYSLVEEGRTKLYITDVAGRIVAVLVNGEMKPGRYTVPLDASGMESGLYFYVLRTPTQTLVRTMNVMK